jgi:hypothetical protein
MSPAAARWGSTRLSITVEHAAPVLGGVIGALLRVDVDWLDGEPDAAGDLSMVRSG